MPSELANLNLPEEGPSAADVGALDTLLEVVRGLGSRESVVQILEMVERFPMMAPFNAMLVYMQRPDATTVLSATDWKELDRFPKATARPIVILKAFGPVGFVYDVSDMDGEKLPSQLTLGNLGGNAFGVDGNLCHEDLVVFFARCLKQRIFVEERVARVMKAGHAVRTGEDSFRIELNVDHQPGQKFSTLCHEVGHIFCGHLGSVKGIAEGHSHRTYETQETEAELTAYLVAKRFGVTPASANYLSWITTDGVVPQFSLETVLVAVGKIESLFRGKLKRRA